MRGMTAQHDPKAVRRFLDPYELALKVAALEAKVAELMEWKALREGMASRIAEPPAEADFIERMVELEGKVAKLMERSALPFMS